MKKKGTTLETSEEDEDYTRNECGDFVPSGSIIFKDSALNAFVLSSSWLSFVYLSGSTHTQAGVCPPRSGQPSAPGVP